LEGFSFGGCFPTIPQGASLLVGLGIENQFQILIFFKGAMCKKVEYLLTGMQYDIHNYVFSGV